MACENFIDLIFKKIDGEITPEEDALLSAHMSECPECREEYEELLSLEDTLSSLPEEDVPEGFAATVTERIKAQKPVAKTHRFRPYFSVAAACVVLVVVLFYNVIDGTLYKSDSLMDTRPQTESVSGQESIQNKSEEAFYSADSVMEEDASEDSAPQTIENPAMPGESPEDIKSPAAVQPQRNDGPAKPNAGSSRPSSQTSTRPQTGERTSAGVTAAPEAAANEAAPAAPPQTATESADESAPAEAAAESAMNDALPEEGEPAVGYTGSADLTVIEEDEVPLTGSIQSVQDYDITENDDYALIATVNIGEMQLIEALDSIVCTVREAGVYEMSAADYEVFKERLEGMGVQPEEEPLNPQSDKVMIIAAARPRT